MGNKSERRESTDYLYLFAACTGINAAAHIISLIGYSSEIVRFVISASFNYRILALIFTIILLFKLQSHDSKGIEKNSNKAVALIFIINFLLLAYALVIYRKTGKSIYSTSALNTFFYSIPMSIAWISSKLLESTRQSEWQRAVGSYDENENKRNFLWRLKLDFPHLDRSIKRKNLLHSYTNWFLMNMVFFVIALASFTQGFRYYNPIILGVLMFAFRASLLFILDFIFNLSASLEGECIGFYAHSKRNNSTRYTYTYIVTNFKRKVEVRFTSEEELFIQEGELVKIYYTLLSRRILKYHEISYLEDN